MLVRACHPRLINPGTRFGGGVGVFRRVVIPGPGSAAALGFSGEWLSREKSVVAGRMSCGSAVPRYLGSPLLRTGLPSSGPANNPASGLHGGGTPDLVDAHRTSSTRR
jgi:hypothetical protein